MAPQQPSPDPALVAAILAYQAQGEALRDRTGQYVQRLWRSLGEYRATQIGLFLRQIVPVIAGAQQKMSALTVASLAAQKQITLGGPFRPAAVDLRRVIAAAARNGVSPETVYQRPFHLVWRQLRDLPRKPASIDEAITSGMNRAVNSALTDLQLAKTRTAREVLRGDDQVTGHRRVIEGARTCGLCIVASTQRYRKAELQPIHPGCDCGVAEIIGEQDPGQVIDPETLEDLHERIAERFGAYARGGRTLPAQGLPDYRDVLVIHEHGELGPVLAVRGAPFTGASDL